MDSIINRRLGRETAYEDIKECHRQARISGISSFVIGSATTYAVLKFTKTFKRHPKYIPLVCLGVGSLCGYIKSIMVIQDYNKMLQQLEASKNLKEKRETVTNPKENESFQQELSKYGDKGFYLEEKGS